MTKKFDILQIDGIDYKTTFTQKWLNREKWEVRDERLIVAQIPGTIMKVIVNQGDEVEEGDLLLILQAMKMDNKIVAPVRGKIKQINVLSGDKVTKGQIMVEIE